MHREQEAKTGRKLAVYFPGIGYHCDKPLLYYSRRLAAEAGYEELQLSYTFSGGNIRGNKEKMREAFFALYEQAKEQLGAVDWSACDEILFAFRQRKWEKKIWKACCVPGRQDRAQARTSVWCIDWISRWRASWCWPGQKRLRQL